jgi:hypothetical protein
MNWYRAALFSLLLVPSATAAAGVQGEIDVEILIGRIEVMHDQTARGLSVLGVMQGPADGEQNVPADPLRNQYARLNDAVVRYNNLRDMACGSRAINHPLCGGVRFNPSWYSTSVRAYWTPDDLRRMAEEVQRQTMPLWLAVCDRAKARTGDRNFCAIE